MRVPTEWLREFVEFDLSPGELGFKLTMIGLEIESVEEMHGDTVLEVSVTPNRPDCLSILGIAREVSALLNMPLRYPHSVIGGTTGACDVKVEILDEDLCHRYAGRTIKGVLIRESPEWMQRRLEQCGMRAINNVVDITNYVLLELGHPLHAFDMDTLQGKIIRVKRAGPGRSIKTLDGTTHTLPGDALLIWDGSSPVAVAGVMGGAETEVSAGTNHIFLESAYFLPSSIRRTSKALGLKTESSYRFERDTDIELLERALDRAAVLMSELAGGGISEKADEYPKPFLPSRIEVRYQKVNKILGTSVSSDEMRTIVKKLGMDVMEQDESFVAVPPPYRTDVQREIDVIEEIARFHGYERIPVTVPKTRMSRETRDKSHHRIASIRDSLRRFGFTEAINYSFMNEKMLDTLSLPGDDPRRKTVILRNPINKEESRLRTTLIPSLLQNLVSNLSLGNRDVQLFEISRVFSDKGSTLPEERHYLGAVSLKEGAQFLWRDAAPDFYVVKGVVESLFSELRVSDYAFVKKSEHFLHPGKSCGIMVSGEGIGFLGVLHPGVIEKLDLKISRQDIVIFEIDLERLFLHVSEKISYTPIPRYPHIDRDIALIVDEDLPAARIVEAMKAFPAPLIEDIFIFDCFRGKNIPEGKKSLAFAIRFRAKDRTLTDSEIEELYQNLVRHVTERTGGTIRGL